MKTLITSILALVFSASLTLAGNTTTQSTLTAPTNLWEDTTVKVFGQVSPNSSNDYNLTDGVGVAVDLDLASNLTVQPFVFVDDTSDASYGANLLLTLPVGKTDLSVYALAGVTYSTGDTWTSQYGVGVQYAYTSNFGVFADAAYTLNDEREFSDRPTVRFGVSWTF